MVINKHIRLGLLLIGGIYPHFDPRASELL